jgi:hypothetical protein
LAASTSADPPGRSADSPILASAGRRQITVRATDHCPALKRWGEISCGENRTFSVRMAGRLRIFG